MAGNVKEWCWNAAGAGRYVLGGAWNEAPYMFNEDESRDPWQREENLGFRCAEFKEADPLLAPIEAIFRDYSREEPVSDEVFEVFRSLYAYDRAELNSEVESNTEEQGIQCLPGHGHAMVQGPGTLPGLPERASRH